MEVVIGLLALGAAWAALGQTTPARQPTQAQAARQFLTAVVRGNYPQAYARLAPEVTRAISLAKFRATARPIRVRALRLGTGITLYKLGVRLAARGSARLFYTFSFAADSVLATPSVMLEATFRDTTARQILSFTMREAVRERPLAPPVPRKRPR